MRPLLIHIPGPPTNDHTVQNPLTWIRHSVCVHPLDAGAHSCCCISVCKCCQVQEFQSKVVFLINSPRASGIKISNTVTERVEGENEMSDHGGVSASILQGIYSCADVCVCQVLTVNFWAWAGTRPSVVWELSGWVVLMAASGELEGIEVCVYEGETVVPSE